MRTAKTLIRLVSCAAIEQDCTLGLVIQIFNDSYDVGVDVVPYPVKGLLEVYEDMVESLLILQVLLAEDPEIAYSVVLLLALKPA